MRKYWFFCLMASTCLEGLGRKYLPSVPSIVFYFLKDIVLLWGYFTFRPPPYVSKIVKFLYRGFIPIWGMAVLWTFLEVFNPEHMSLPLAAIGLRAYWFWWIAPFVVAAALQHPGERRRAILTMSVMAAGIAVFAAIQFVSPADSAVNLYSVVDGEAQYAADTGIVYDTGRARVSSTFAFISGFADFTILIPTLLLSLGLETNDRRVRLFALVATLLSGAVLPMSGSRASVILGMSVLVLTCWSAGLFFTAIAGAVLATVAFPDALLGVESRFKPEETQERIYQNAMVIPPVALLASDYPMMGIGTGMQQNARASLKVFPKWQVEIEMQRYLIELGPVGFLLVWGAKFGLMVALLRAYRILQRAKRRAAASAALSYAAVTFFGNITFDHIWQALYFIGSGFILAETLDALQSMSKPATTESAESKGVSARDTVTVAAAGR